MNFPLLRLITQPEYLLELWQLYPHNKLHKIFPKLDDCVSCQCTNRREQTSICQLHTGHMCMTPFFLLKVRSHWYAFHVKSYRTFLLGFDWSKRLAFHSSVVVWRCTFIVWIASDYLKVLWACTLLMDLPPLPLSSWTLMSHQLHMVTPGWVT